MKALKTGSDLLRQLLPPLFMPQSPVPATEGPRIYFSSPSGASGSESHDHGDHVHHDHDDHDHDDHEGHDHGDHDDHEGHDHGDHDDHAGHNHGDHDDHEGHDHGDHDDHDHDDHEGHDHGDHDDHAGHDHHGGHDHAHDLRGASRRNLTIALVLISTYMLAEVVGGILSGSLALIADAGHMLTDAAAIAMALVAMWIAERVATAERTFGYERTEVLAAMLNTVALWLIAGWIMFEAYHRSFGTEDPHVDGLPVLIVGTGGLLINIAAAWVLHRSAGHSMNVEGAFQHVLADLMGSVGVIISAILILSFAQANPADALWGFNWFLVDPILSVLIALLILWSSRHLMGTVMNVLLEGTPQHIDAYELCNEIEEVEGVTLIHDVHIWTITSGSEAFTAHILVDPSYEGGNEVIRTTVQDLIHNRYGISHATIQLEQTGVTCKEDHHVDHLLHTSRPSAS